MSGLDLVTPPATEPLTLQDVLPHLRSLSSDLLDADEGLVNAYIMAARSSAETVLKMSLLETGWRYRIDGGFPFEIILPMGPVFDKSSVAVKYIDDAGTEQTLDTERYQVSAGETCRIRPAWGSTWPVTRPVYDAVTIEFTAGRDSADKIPPAILQALRLTVGDAFAHRENTVVGAITSQLPVSARNLLMPFVRHD